MGERDDKKGGYWRSCLVEGKATSSNDPCTLYALCGYFIPETVDTISVWLGDGAPALLDYCDPVPIDSIQRRIWK